MRKDIFEKTIEIVKNIMLEASEEADFVKSLEINEDTHMFRDLGLDSIQILMVITELEDLYEMEFPDEDMDMDYLLVMRNLVDAVIRGIDNKE